MLTRDLLALAIFCCKVTKQLMSLKQRKRLTGLSATAADTCEQNTESLAGLEIINGGGRNEGVPSGVKGRLGSKPREAYFETNYRKHRLMRPSTLLY